jgi:hypothetical protein
MSTSPFVAAAARELLAAHDCACSSGDRGNFALDRVYLSDPPDHRTYEVTDK